MPKILVADDDADLVTTLCTLLEAKGYKTFYAYEGIGAVELAHSLHPDLILLDWKMPVAKGSAVLEMLREKKDTKNIPVIILTGANEPYMSDNASQFGVFAYILKPYDQQALLTAIQSALTKS